MSSTKFLLRTLKPTSNQAKDPNLALTSGNFLLLKVSFFLFKDVIYEVCFRVRSEREIGQMIIQYTAENLFNLDHA